MAGTEKPDQADGNDAGADPDAVRAAAARAGLVRLIAASGGLADPRWRAAFEQVPRHLFVPCYYVGALGGYERLSCTDRDPRRRARWLEGAYADGPLATHVRDGRLVSSSSQPSLMAMMLDALEVTDGCRVLEIGAGTGYNAALLAHRLGDGAVTTVDLDEDITSAARAHLAAAGRRPAVITGDGALGHPEGAPYDRVIATCALPSVPRAWVEQCRAGALILAPLATGLIALRVRDAAAAGAEGRFLRTPAYFVPLRSPGRGGGAPDPAADEDDGADGALRGLPRDAVRSELFRFLLTLTADSLDPHEAYELWRHERRPGRERFGVTVQGDRQWAWLDSPDGPYAWRLT